MITILICKPLLRVILITRSFLTPNDWGAWDQRPTCAVFWVCDRVDGIKYANLLSMVDTTDSSMSIVILDNYDSFTYNLYQMVQAQTELSIKVFRNNALTWEELLALRPDRVILSPGPGHPSRPSDFGLCQQVLQQHEALNCPILGVCLGHQGMAHYFGGKVVPAPAIVHGKTSPVRIVKPSPLLIGLPNPFTVMRYHSWTVDPAELPVEFEVIAELCTESTPNQLPLVMAMQHRSKPLYGVQFHPESVGTPQGAQLLGNFLAIKSPQLATQ